MPAEKPFYKSKKWLFAAVGALVPVVNHLFGLGLTVETVLEIIGPISAYVVGQGLADFGKNGG